MEWQEAWLRALMVKGLTRKNRAIVAQQLMSGVDGAAIEAAMTPEQAASFRTVDADTLARSLAWLSRQGNHLLPYDSPGYPFLLNEINSAPAALFVRGNPNCLSETQLAMVGSRKYSAYGEQWAAYFASELSAAGLVITSGLALGIDGVCHRGCLSAGGVTIGVLGSGIACLHPASHRPLAERIVEQGGALVSEFLPYERARPEYFPRRNRIISGLSRGVLVVEATRKSGSLITARYALEQGREVFALPGGLDRPESEGTHWLIQQGAYLVATPADVIEQLSGSLCWLPVADPQKEEIISAHEEVTRLPFAHVLANVGDEVVSIDIVAERVGQSIPEVAVALLDLELNGLIEVVSGGYVRVRRAGHVRRSNVPV